MTRRRPREFLRWMARRQRRAGTVGLVGRKRRADVLAERMLTFRATDDEHARYKAAAEAAGLSLGEWLRAAAEAQLKRKRRA